MCIYVHACRVGRRVWGKPGLGLGLRLDIYIIYNTIVKSQCKRTASSTNPSPLPEDGSLELLKHVSQAAPVHILLWWLQILVPWQPLYLAIRVSNPAAPSLLLIFHD